MGCKHLRLLAPILVLTWPTAAHAQLRCEKPVVECGDLRSGQRLSHRFELTNTGRGPLEIVDIRPECGCLVPRVQPRLLAPGDTASLDVEVNTLGQAAGQRSWTAVVRFRHDGAAGELTLELRGLLSTEVTVQPSALTLFTETALSHELTLTDLRPEPLKITAVDTGSTGIKARVLSQERNAAGHGTGKILIEVSGDLPAGRHEQILSIYTDDPLYRQLQVPVRHQAHSRVSFGPREVIFTAAAGQGFSARLVRFWAGDDTPVEIAGAHADDPALTCTWAAGPGNAATLKIQAERSRLSTLPINTAVHVELRRPAADTVTIPVTIETD